MPKIIYILILVGILILIFIPIDYLKEGMKSGTFKYHNRSILSSLNNFQSRITGSRPLNSTPIFIITIDRNKDRWDRILKLADVIGLKLNKFTGIDGLDHQYNDEENKLFNYGYYKNKKSILRNKPTKNSFQCEKGCALSHYYLWKKIVSENISRCVIAEDDVIFTGKLSAELDLIDMLDYDVIYLYYNKNRLKTNKNGITRINKIAWIGAGNCCYLISNRGAKKIVNIIENDGINCPIDWLLLNNCDRLKLGVFSKTFANVNFNLPSSIDKK